MLCTTFDRIVQCTVSKVARVFVPKAFHQVHSWHKVEPKNKNKFTAWRLSKHQQTTLLPHKWNGKRKTVELVHEHVNIYTVLKSQTVTVCSPKAHFCLKVSEVSKQLHVVLGRGSVHTAVSVILLVVKVFFHHFYHRFILSQEAETLWFSSTF